MAEQVSLNCAVLTSSDTRTLENDTSGQYLCDQLQTAGHVVADREIIADDIYLLRAKVAHWIADPTVQVIIVTGGTGFTHRDSTPEALAVLFDKYIDGFGELFRHLSYQDIGSSTVQSRAIAGLSNNTLIFCLPGSTGACRLAWEKLLSEQLNSEHRPCNFAELLDKYSQSH